MRTVSVKILLPLFVLAAQVYAQNITAKKTTVTTITTTQGDFSVVGLSPGS
jgi:hypothetical protein